MRVARGQAEASRLQNGIAAGTDLRDRLLAASLPATYADLTSGYMVRTVGILERGLQVLHQQQDATLKRLSEAERTTQFIQDQMADMSANLERRQAQSVVSELITLVISKAGR